MASLTKSVPRSGGRVSLGNRWLYGPCSHGSPLRMPLLTRYVYVWDEAPNWFLVIGPCLPRPWCQLRGRQCWDYVTPAKKGRRRDLAPQPRWHSTFRREMLFSYSLRLAWCPPTPPGDLQGWLKLASIHLLRSHLTPIYPTTNVYFGAWCYLELQEFFFIFLRIDCQWLNNNSIDLRGLKLTENESLRVISELSNTFAPSKKNKKKLELLFPPNVAVPNPFSGDARRQIKAQIAVKNVGTQSRESIAAPDRRHQS